MEIIEVDVQDEDEAAFIRGLEERAPQTGNSRYLTSRHYKDGPEGPNTALTMLLRQQQGAGLLLICYTLFRN